MHRILTVAAFLLACSAPAKAEPPGYWLLKERPRFQDAQRDAYHAAVAGAFADEAGMVGGCFQMLTLIDDGRPEEIVFVSCSPKQGLVVHLVANESIWKKLHSDGFEAATNVEVKRTEVALSVADWRLLHDVLLKLLRLAKTDDDPRQRELGEDYYFSTCQILRGCMGGVAKTPPAGSPAAQLVEIAKLLAQASDAPKQRKAELASAARSKAKQLSKWLEKMATYGGATP
jgi:hypothetical protein